MTKSVRISARLHDRARKDAQRGRRTISGQIAHWALVGRAALDNRDWPVNFVAVLLFSLTEPRELATVFVPCSRGQLPNP